MSGLKIAVIFFIAILNGMKTVYGIWNYKENTEPFWKVWNCRWLYAASAVSLAAGSLLFILGKEGFYLLKYADLLYTYILLAVVDQKTKKVPDTVLLVFLAAQLLMAGAGNISGFMEGILGSLIFSVIIILVSVTSGGKMGLGDAKLLAVTAIMAGWSYTLVILCIAMALSLVYGIWLMLFRHLSSKEEMPFVPFLCLGVMIHLVYFLRS